VRFVVTEYGVADLYGKNIRQRARALINVAHPEFREELERQAKELKYL
jgi:4-hydroxybutyrate CoA-transferase